MPPSFVARAIARLPRTAATALAPIGLYAIGALVFFRWQILSQFDRVFGDRGDARMVAFLHEHVYRWLFTHTGFLSPPFFYNQTKTLGYTDAFLLDQLIYAPLRLLGAEPLLATSLIAVVLSPFAYLFLYLFLRRLDVSVLMASLAAFIFTFANNLYLQSAHLQHFAVYYIPVIAYCGLVAVSDVHRRPCRAYLLAAFGAGLFGLLFSTAYYMAWFFGLALLIFTPLVARIAWPEACRWLSARPARILGLGLVAGLVFLSTLSVFAAIYGPVVAIGARRAFGEYLVYAPMPNDVVNVGIANLVWSGLIRSLHLISDDRLSNIELCTALTPVVEILLVASAVLALRPGLWSTNEFGRTRRSMVIASATVCFLFYLLTVKVHKFSLFYFLYATVPGANAIRDGYRAMIVANLFAVTAIALTFDRLLRSLWQEPRTALRYKWIGVFMAVLSLAAIEQVNLIRQANLSRTFEREHMSAVAKAPRECRSFYAAPQADFPPFGVQIDAMMVALAQHLPTINGYSGLNPPGWGFYDTEATNYEQRAQRWAVDRGVADGLCRIDVERGTWEVLALDHEFICAATGCSISLDQSGQFEINLARDGNGVLFTDDHWVGPESWGQWTGAKQAALWFSVGVPRDLSISLSLRPLLSASAPKQSVWVDANGCRVGAIDFDFAHGSKSQTISGTIPARCVAGRKVVLNINTDRMRSPKELGINDDVRRLGIGIEKVVVRRTDLVER